MRFTLKTKKKKLKKKPKKKNKKSLKRSSMMKRKKLQNCNKPLHQPRTHQLETNQMQILHQLKELKQLLIQDRLCGGSLEVLLLSDSVEELSGGAKESQKDLNKKEEVTSTLDSLTMRPQTEF